jgi:hypothetical protein
MVERMGSQVTQAGKHFFEHHGPGSGGAGRIIGIMAVTLLAGSSAFGQFVIQPLKVVVQAPPGRRAPIDLYVENTSETTIQTVYLRLADIFQDSQGIWQAIEPDTRIDESGDGTRWAVIPSEVEGEPDIRMDISKMRSCQSWLKLGPNANDPNEDKRNKHTVTVSPLHRVPIRLYADVPAGTRGYYSAALLAQALLGPQEIQGVMSNVLLEFVVPIIIQIQGRPEPHKVELTDIGMEFRPMSSRAPAASVVNLGVKNLGGTYSLLKGYARIWNKFGGRWRKITDVEFPSDISIVPGAQFHLSQDVGIPLGSGEYRVQGYLYVDSAQADQITGEMRFIGDPRVRTTNPSAALDLDPVEMFIRTAPGQTRAESLLVVNASDDRVTVDVGIGLPPNMMNAVAGNVRGDQFECSDWVSVSPQQFTLAGHQRTNLRVLSRMPASATSANYYAMIYLNSRYADGQEGGKTDCRVCIENKSVQPETVVFESAPLTLKETTPGRYAVVARFGNFGTVHVQPECRAILTAVPSGEVIRRITLSSDILNEGGLLLPLEQRNFQGVLDVSGVSAGMYRLTAQMFYGGPEPRREQQTGLQVVDGADGKSVRQIDVNQVPGGKITIGLK